MSLFRSIAIVSICGLVPITVVADLQQCDGVWTNKPCSGVAKKSIVERVAPPRDPADIERDRRKLLIHNLDMKRISARDQHGLEIGIISERSICMSTEATEQQCVDAVAAKEREIDERILASVQAPVTNQVIDLSQQEQTIIIQQNNNINVARHPKLPKTPTRELTPEEEAHLRQLMLRGEIEDGTHGLSPSGPAGNN